MSGVIYSVKNNVNNKRYIGQTKYQFESRKKEHINEANRGEGFYFHRALRKYNFDFTWEIIEDDIDLEILDDKERYYIEIFNTFNSDFGYNLTSGGDFCQKIKYSKIEIEFILEKRYEFRGLKEILCLFNIRFSRELKNVYSINKIIKKYIKEGDEVIIKFNIKSKNSKNRVETTKSRNNRSKAQLGKTHTPETINKLKRIKTGTKHRKDSIEKIIKNNKKRIEFTPIEIRLILNKINEGLSKRKIIIMLNTLFGYNIRTTSTGVINRVLRDYQNL